jgi:hypothetical protein
LAKCEAKLHGIAFPSKTWERYKTIRLFNPRKQRWHEHFQWSLDATKIIGLTPEGRVTVETLQMNNEYVLAARHFWMIAGWHPPE